MRRINFKIFFGLTLALSIITYFSFNAAFARDEGKLGSSGFRIYLADLYNIVRFPTHVLFPSMVRLPLPFALGLIINCVVYGLVLERIISYVIFFIVYKNKTVDE